MSDFDKEAEREKLREKYGDETEDRETTQQMSELLLQGATMTNRHCDECGDPVFRHEGQEFCPTCQSPGGDTAEDAGAQSDSEGTQTGEAVARTADDDRQGAERASAAPGPGTGGDGRDVPSTPSPQAPTGASPSPRGDQSGDPRGERAPPRERSGAGGDDLAEAQRSLARTLSRFARNAEAAEDPRAAKEHLAAAREAAQALSALWR
jgi:uncharacterized Zn finger protein (UPF0148 family)